MYKFSSYLIENNYISNTKANKYCYKWGDSLCCSYDVKLTNTLCGQAKVFSHGTYSKHYAVKV
jgi:hypothetical protein